MFHKRRALDPTWPKQWFDHKPVLWRVAECVLWRESVAGVFKNDKEISGNKDQVSRKVHCQQVLEQSSMPPSNTCHNPDHHTMWKFSLYTKYARPPLILSSTVPAWCLLANSEAASLHGCPGVQANAKWVDGGSTWKVLDLLKQYVVLDFFLTNISGAHPFWQVGYDGLVVWSTVNVFYWSPPNSACLFEVVEKTSL